MNDSRPNLGYRLVVFDLDGTLVDEGLRMTAEDLSAIQELRRRRIAVTLATGRTYRSALPYMEKLHVDLPVILCNGAAVVSPGDCGILYQQKLRPEAAGLIVEKARRADLDCLLYTDPLSACPTVSSLTPLLADFIVLEGLRCVEINDLAGIVATSPPLKVQVVGSDQEALRSFQREAAIEVPEISIVMTQSDYLEAAPAGVSKGSALLKLSGLLSIPLAQIAAFGDGLNDLELISLAGLGFSMADAPEQLRKAADRTVPSVAAGLMELLGG